MKSQMKKADASGAGYALILGADEWEAGEVTLKNLREGQGSATQQLRVALNAAGVLEGHLAATLE